MVLAPVAAGFGAGVVLRGTGVATARDGDFLFLLNMYVCLPALVFLALSEVAITPELMVFPLAALAMVGLGYVGGRGVVHARGMGTSRGAVVVIGFMIVNSSFALPFAEALYGEAGVARIAAFDIVNTTLVFTAAYAVAARANPAHSGRAVLLGRLVRTPPLYGIALGLLVNVTDATVPDAVTTVLAPFGAVTPVLIAVATGILFKPVRGQFRRAGQFAAARLLLGLLVGLVVVLAFDLEGVDRGVLLLLAVAPLGFFAVTFSSLENLDVDLAAQTLAVSLLGSFALSLLVSAVFATA